MTRVTLAQGRLGPAGLWIFAVVASSPLTVLVGGIPTMYAKTGVIGVPLAFVAVGLVLGLLAVGYVGASRHLKHAAAFYALLARGFAPWVGVAGGAVALLGYAAIGSSLYGLGGAILADLGGGSWSGWATAVWVIVGVLGLLGGLTSARVLGGLLAVELGVIVLFDAAALSHPVWPLDFRMLSPGELLVPGVSGVLAFAMAAFVGLEIAPILAEEARGGHTVAKASAAAVGFAGLFYGLAAFAMAVNAGPAVAQKAGDPAGGPLATLDAVYGAGVGIIVTVLLVTSIVAAMSSFHGAGARYVFGMAREGALPGWLATVSRRGAGGTPVAASIAQSVVAGLMLLGFARLDADPMVMFGWLSTIGAVSILALLVVAAGAAYRFFALGQGTNDSVWVRRVAPVTGCVAGGLLLAMMVANLASLLDLPQGSRLPWLVPGVIAAVAMLGCIWGITLQVTSPQRAREFGRVVADPVISPVARLAKLEM